MSHDAGPVEGGNKKIALLIGILALFLAFSEQGGNEAQTNSLAANVEASNLWAFFQAKTIRGTVVRTAAEQLEFELDAIPDPARKAAAQKRIDTWKATQARWDSEPETQEGRKELAARAKAAEDKRDLQGRKHDHYEVSSAALQLAIVIASSSIITGIAALIWVAAGLGVVGAVFMGIAAFAPMAVHLI
ncbi:hypothetical protein GCM10007036_42390 [Alsobacter metallidurans]|uniref:DUF4337 domain-containing protein n=1 Tax=Alsobacter metallidurans TaxID=340221 RepID=A0A917IAR6_9HYPH|nr:DUF4337 domain-containing protein [Alsobacter metallidurans]GGH31284.1 hypothetical protein GCM10007036_42390 [Alsobacter metallidurans]